jgi:hypothetical protein
VTGPRPAPPAQPAASTNNERQRDRCVDRAPHRRNVDDLDAYIKELIESAPPLTSEQRDRLALLLRIPRHPQ